MPREFAGYAVSGDSAGAAAVSKRLVHSSWLPNNFKKRVDIFDADRLFVLRLTLDHPFFTTTCLLDKKDDTVNVYHSHANWNDELTAIPRTLSRLTLHDHQLVRLLSVSDARSRVAHQHHASLCAWQSALVVAFVMHSGGRTIHIQFDSGMDALCVCR